MSKKYFALIGFFCVLFFTASFLYAQASNEDSVRIENQGEENSFIDETSISLSENTETVQTSSRSTFFLLLRMIIVLAIVVGCIYAVLYMMRRSMKTEANNDQFLRQVASISVAPGKTVQVVTLIDHAYLIGVGEDSVNLISEVQDKELIDAMNLYADTRRNETKPRSFADILEIFMPNGPRDSNSVFSGAKKNVSEMLKNQREKLNREE